MVLEQERKDAVLHAMTDESMRKILLSTVANAKSAEEIIAEAEIPMSTCYRRIQTLLDLRLLRVERTIISEAGKKHETYRSRVKNATVNFSSGEISIDVTIIPEEPAEHLSQIWRAVRREELQVVCPVG